MIAFDPRDCTVWSYDRDTGFSAFASDAFGKTNPPQLFEFHNPATGTRVSMKLDAVERDQENDILSFVYRCSAVVTNDPLVDVKHLSRCMARVFND